MGSNISGGLTSITSGGSTLVASTDQSRVSAGDTTRGMHTGFAGWADPGDGPGARNTQTTAVTATSLGNTTLNGANVNITATGGLPGTTGTASIAGTTVNTPSTSSVTGDTGDTGDTVTLKPQETTLSVETTGKGKKGSRPQQWR